MSNCIILAGALLAGCAHQATYNLAHLEEARRPAAQKFEGKILVHTTREDDAYIFSGNPTSFTGSATTLTIPVGLITREAARAAFTDVFKEGAEASSEIQNRGAYVLVVSPKVTAYSYEYNQLKNVGFAITPTIRVRLRVRTVDESGKAVWERNYESGDVEGAAWVLNLSPAESMSKLTHKAIYDLLFKAAADIAAEIPGISKPTTR